MDRRQWKKNDGILRPQDVAFQKENKSAQSNLEAGPRHGRLPGSGLLSRLEDT